MVLNWKNLSTKFIKKIFPPKKRKKTANFRLLQYQKFRLPLKYNARKKKLKNCTDCGKGFYVSPKKFHFEKIQKI